MKMPPHCQLENDKGSSEEQPNMRAEVVEKTDDSSRIIKNNNNTRSAFYSAGSSFSGKTNILP
jgi:hypothetical protein